MTFTKRQVLEAKSLESEKVFQTLAKAGTVAGDYSDRSWRYRGHRLLFVEIGSRAVQRDSVVELPLIAEMLGKCYTVFNMTRSVSPELAISRLNAFRWLAKTIGTDESLWYSLSRYTFNRFLENLKRETSITTVYHRATGLVDFIKFYNSISYRLEGVEHRLCSSVIKWKHGIPNPIRSGLDSTAQAQQSRREELYEEDLHVALSAARVQVVNDPSLEPRPGYDRIRLEALAFAMAQGLRIGEVCALPVNCLVEDEASGRMFCLVPTEKGATPGATAMPEIWEDIIRQAYAYLLEVCAPARQRAFEIEENGFAFIRIALKRHRDLYPLSKNRIALLNAAQLNVEEYYFIDEMCSSLDITSKEFSSSGSYNNSAVNLPKLVASKIVLWLDQRFECWDWTNYSTQRFELEYRLKWESLCSHSGVSTSPLVKAHWFIDDLRELIDAMTYCQIFHPETVTSEAKINEFRRQWQYIRTKALSHRGGNGCVAIDISHLTQSLKKTYSDHLSTHFKEELGTEGNPSGIGYQGKNVRPGMQTRLSNHLIVVWDNQFRGRGSLGIIPRPISRTDFYNYLCKKGSKITVFERLDIKDKKGKLFSISPHHIRRWVTTAILRSGPCEAAIDLWMGRSPRQTRHYDYRTAKERAEYVRSLYVKNVAPPNDVLGKMVIKWRDQKLTDDQIEMLIVERLKAVHYTPWGGCSRELYISPCDKGLMCLRGFGTASACASFQINPSDMIAKEAIRGTREHYAKLLAIIDNNYSPIANAITVELSNTEAFDQHILYMIDVVKGCDAALQAYENFEEAS